MAMGGLTCSRSFRTYWDGVKQMKTAEQSVLILWVWSGRCYLQV